jgi:hypothetical protein
MLASHGTSEESAELGTASSVSHVRLQKLKQLRLNRVPSGAIQMHHCVSTARFSCNEATHHV